MHELPFTKNILGVALRYARENDATRVKSIFLRIGVLRDMQEEWIRRYFSYVSRGTIAQGAELFILPEPLVLACRGCGEKFSPDLGEFVDADDIECPACGGDDYEMESGTEFIVQSIEIESS